MVKWQRKLYRSASSFIVENMYFHHPSNREKRIFCVWAEQRSHSNNRRFWFNEKGIERSIHHAHTHTHAVSTLCVWECRKWKVEGRKKGNVKNKYHNAVEMSCEKIHWYNSTIKHRFYVCWLYTRLKHEYQCTFLSHLNWFESTIVECIVMCWWEVRTANWECEGEILLPAGAFFPHFPSVHFHNGLSYQLYTQQLNL